MKLFQRCTAAGATMRFHRNDCVVVKFFFAKTVVILLRNFILICSSKIPRRKKRSALANARTHSSNHCKMSEWQKGRKMRKTGETKSNSKFNLGARNWLVRCAEARIVQIYFILCTLHAIDRYIQIERQKPSAPAEKMRSA